MRTVVVRFDTPSSDLASAGSAVGTGETWGTDRQNTRISRLSIKGDTGSHSISSHSSSSPTMAFVATAICSHVAPGKRRDRIVSTFCRSIMVGPLGVRRSSRTQIDRQLFRPTWDRRHGAGCRRRRKPEAADGFSADSGHFRSSACVLGRIRDGGTQRADGTHMERIRIEQHGFMGTVWFAGYSSRSDTST
jgi:hypothetical protein